MRISDWSSDVCSSDLKTAVGRLNPLDILLALLTLGCIGWFAWAADSILAEGWEFAAPLTAKILGAVLWVLILEALRRTGGTAIFVIVLAISLYPVVADVMPGPIRGIGQTLPDTLAYHIVSSERSEEHTSE